VRSVAETPVSVLMVWKAQGADPALWECWNHDDRSTPPRRIPQVGGSSHGPSLANVEGLDYGPGSMLNRLSKVVMVWRGIGQDEKIWWSVHQHPGNWLPQRVVNDDFRTSERPAICRHRNQLLMVWKGPSDDPHMYWSAYDGHSWSEKRLVKGGHFGTSHGPALLGNDGDRPAIMAWKGQLDDTHIYWASHDQGRWSRQQLAGEEKGTSHAPALIRYGTRMYLAWKGKHDDAHLWWSHFHVRSWTRQEKVPGVGGELWPCAVGSVRCLQGQIDAGVERQGKRPSHLLLGLRWHLVCAASDRWRSHKSRPRTRASSVLPAIASRGWPSAPDPK
jgi:hypothetical protein